MEDTTPYFFPTPEDLRAWFEANHDTVDVMWVGYYKKATRLPSVTVPESVDAALCFGWIDGLKRTVDDKAYKIRFTPRRRRSHWSPRNLGRMKQLLAQGVVTEAGLAAYERRDKNRDRAAYEPEVTKLPAEYERRIRADPAAWDYFRNARAVLPQAGRPLGGEREEGGDPPAPPRHPHRVQRQREGDPAHALDGEAQGIRAGERPPSPSATHSRARETGSTAPPPAHRSARRPTTRAAPAAAHADRVRPACRRRTGGR